MGEENKVILHGVWASHYVKRVEIALKLKGIPFEFVEEDLSNKSPLLLNYNPVYKKVPVLVHNGKPVSESLIIVEYIDETWKNSPRFLPEDPFERAQARFWADYIQKVIFQCMANIVNSKGEEQVEACEKFYEKLRVLEDGVKDLFPGGDPRPQGRNVGLLDIVIVPTLGAYKAQEEVFGAKFVNPEKNPLIHSWLTSLLDLPVMKEIAPSHEKMVSLLEILKKSGVKFSPDS